MSEDTKPVRPKHEDCDLTCDIETKMWGETEAEWCKSCFFIFSHQKLGKQEVKLKERKQEREKTVDKSITEASRKEKSKKYKSDVNIKELYEVVHIENNETHSWLKHKHYAKRIPLITHAFGLKDKKENVLIGVVTYAPPARSLNDGYGCFGEENPIQTYELNRLVVEDNLPKNTLSYFVTGSLELLKSIHEGKPVCVVSYADANNNHHGYIYQATNWIYTGETQPVKVFYDTNTKKNVHARTIVAKYGSSADESLPNNITYEYEKGGKFRYFRFLGSKGDVKFMKKILKYKVQDYPKGKNERYDSSHEVAQQVKLDLFGDD